MRTALLTLALLCLAAPASAGALDTAGVQKTLPAFQAAVEAHAADPEAIAQLAVLAIVVYSRDEELARQMYSLLVEPEDTEADKKSPTGRKVTRAVADDLARTRGKSDLVRGFCGGTPEARYEDADLESCAVAFDRTYSATRQGLNYPSEGRAKYFMTNGGSRPKPIELILLDGRWHLRNWGGLLTGVAAPAE